MVRPFQEMLFQPPGQQLQTREDLLQLMKDRGREIPEAGSREGGVMQMLSQLFQSGATGITQGVDAAAGALKSIPESIAGAYGPEGGLSQLIQGHKVSQPQMPAAPIGPRPEPEAPLMTPEPQVELTEPEPERQFSGLTPSLGEMPGPQPDPAPDMQDRLAGVDSQEKARQIALIVEGLTRAGAEFTNVRSLQELMAGSPKQKTDQSNADRLAKLRQLSAEREEQSIKDAKNPIIDMINKKYDQKFETPEQAREYMAMKGTEADIENVESTSAARTGKAQLNIEKEKFTADMAKRFAGGDYSAAPQKIKDEILKEVNIWTKDNKNVTLALAQADKIESFLESGNSVGARAAITQLVLLGGETGRLTEGDIGRSSKRMGFQGYKDFVENFVISNLNEEQRAEILDIVHRARQLAVDKLKKTSTTTANRLMKFYPQFKQNDLVEFMVGKDESGKEKKFWAVVLQDSDDGEYKKNTKELVTEQEFSQLGDLVERL